MASLQELQVIIGADISGLLAGVAQAETGLGRVSAAAEGASGRYRDSMNRLRESNGRFVSSAQLAAEASGNVGNAFTSAGAKAQGLRGVISAAAAGFTAALGGLTLLGKAALTSAGDIQALEKGFAATYKGSEELGVALGKVKELAKLPGLGLKEALEGATNLQAAGFSADLATRSLGAFGNALATVGKGKAELDGVSTALTQIASKGKISAEEIGQLSERVPQIRAAMQAAFGTSDTEVLQKAGIGATEFVEKVTAELEKLPKVFGGLNAAGENFEDSITKSGANIGSALNRAFDIEGLIGKAGAAVEEFGAVIAGLEPTFRDIAEYFGPSGEGGFLFNELADSVSNAAVEIQGAFDALNGGANSTTLVKTLIRDIVLGFTAAADVVGGVIGSITRALKGDFVGAEEQAQRALGALTAPISNALGLTKQLSGSFNDAFRDIGGGFDGVNGAVGDFGTASAVAKVKTEDQTKALEKQLKALQDLDKGFENVGLRSTKGLRPQDAPEFIEVKPEKAPELPTKLLPLPGFDTTAQAASVELARANYLKLSDAEKLAYEGTLDFNTNIEAAFGQLGESIGPLLGDIALIAGEAFGSIVTGAASFSDGIQGLFGGILSALAGFMGDFGKQLIAIGIGKLGLDTLFAGPQGGPLAIAAGVGLVALAGIAGSVAKNSAKGLSSVANGGGRSGGSSLATAPRSNFTPTAPPPAAAPVTIVHKVEFFGSGDAIRGAIDISTTRTGRVLGV